MLIEKISGEPLCFHVLPFDNPKLQCTLQAQNQVQKNEWTLQLKKVILETYNAAIPSHVKKLVMELGKSKTDGVFTTFYLNYTITLKLKKYLALVFDFNILHGLPNFKTPFLA